MIKLIFVILLALLLLSASAKKVVLAKDDKGQSFQMMYSAPKSGVSSTVNFTLTTKSTKKNNEASSIVCFPTNDMNKPVWEISKGFGVMFECKQPEGCA